MTDGQLISYVMNFVFHSELSVRIRIRDRVYRKFCPFCPVVHSDKGGAMREKVIERKLVSAVVKADSDCMRNLPCSEHTQHNFFLYC